MHAARIGGNFQPATSVCVVTGPNSGSKTRLLQALGLAQLFGQGGFYVCARSDRVPLLLGMFFSVIEHEAAEPSEGRLGRELERIKTMFDDSNRSTYQFDPGVRRHRWHMCWRSGWE